MMSAKETRIFARQLGLKPCFTPVQSPQSNGISEAFVNTLKRDYVHVSPLPDAEIVLGLIAGWKRGQAQSGAGRAAKFTLFRS
jgi:putative transposase